MGRGQDSSQQDETLARDPAPDSQFLQLFRQVLGGRERAHQDLLGGVAVLRFRDLAPPLDRRRAALFAVVSAVCAGVERPPRQRHLSDWLVRFVVAERGREGKDGDALLRREDGPGRVRAAVAEALDLVQDGDVGVAKIEEVGMETMQMFFFLLESSSRVSVFCSEENGTWKGLTSSRRTDWTAAQAASARGLQGAVS